MKGWWRDSAGIWLASNSSAISTTKRTIHWQVPLSTYRYGGVYGRSREDSEEAEREEESVQEEEGQREEAGEWEEE